MMVAVPVFWGAAVAWAASSARNVVNVLTPRMPVYQLRTVSFSDVALSLSSVQATWKADVSLFNENFVKADVHGLRIDMYYPSWDGSLSHIGNLMDLQQRECERTESLTCKNYNYTEPFWTLLPRQTFVARDELSMTLFKMSWKTLGNIVTSAIKGILVVRSTGVAHVKSTAGAAVTIGMICDNVLQVWSQKIVGQNCTVNGLTTGWVDLKKEQQRLKQHAMDRHDKTIQTVQ